MRMRQLSYWISWTALINFMVTLLVALIFKIGVNLHRLDSSFSAVGTTMILYGFLILSAAVIISNKIDQIEDERKERILRKRSKRRSA